MVNSAFVGWDNDATYNTDHTYWLDFSPVADGVVILQVNDTYPVNNTGNLIVDIYAQI
jgi:hypothetical protein